jgi:hypothetical protein
MSPDIQWHVGEDKDQETIARASTPRRSRRSWIAILIVVILGAGLGMAYRSIPEPEPRPTLPPTSALLSTLPPVGSARIPSLPPTVTPTFAGLKETIDREAQALADGDFDSLLALQLRQDQQAINRHYNGFSAWGRPVDDQPLYTIISYTLRTPTMAWADVRQFRNGRWFRETRFYQFKAGESRWLCSEVDPLHYEHLKETRDTLHFHTSYFVEDRDLAQTIIQALEEAYPQVCRDLGCTEAAATLTFTLQLNGTSSGGLWLSGDARELIFTAPSLTGIFEDNPLDGNNLIWLITVAAVQRVYYDAASQSQWRVRYDAASQYAAWHWNGDADGHVVFNAIISWALQQRESEPNQIPALTAALNPQELVPLSKLWGKAYVYDQNNQVQPRADRHIIYPEGGLVIRFIEQEYGAEAMPKLLQALGTAQSFADVIENGLGVPFAEFDQKWQAWVKRNISRQ